MRVTQEEAHRIGYLSAHLPDDAATLTPQSAARSLSPKPSAANAGLFSSDHVSLSAAAFTRCALWNSMYSSSH